MRSYTQGPRGFGRFTGSWSFPKCFAWTSEESHRADSMTFIGNPPFAGKVTLSAATSEGYLDWLQATQAETHGNSDLVAYFFRRTFALLRQNGCLGLIATNTIGQGDTRSTGLQWICKNGGSIYRATRRLRWPGLAAVNVSVVHIRRGTLVGAAILDGIAVPTITAYLFHSGGHDAPSALDENAGGSSRGAFS